MNKILNDIDDFINLHDDFFLICTFGIIRVTYRYFSLDTFNN